MTLRTLTHVFFLCFSMSFLGAMDQKQPQEQEQQQQQRNGDGSTNEAGDDNNDAQPNFIIEDLQRRVTDLYDFLRSVEENLVQDFAGRINDLKDSIAALDSRFNSVATGDALQLLEEDLEAFSKRMTSRVEGQDARFDGCATRDQFAACASNEDFQAFSKRMAERVNAQDDRFAACATSDQFAALNQRIEALERGVATLTNLTPERLAMLSQLVDHLQAHDTARLEAEKRTTTAQEAYAAQHWAKRGASRFAGFVSSVWSNRAYVQVAAVLAMKLCTSGFFYPAADQVCPSDPTANMAEALLIADLLQQAVRK